MHHTRIICSSFFFSLVPSMIHMAATYVLILLMAWSQAADAQRGMPFTYAFKMANWWALENDFMTWVEQVEQDHLQSVKAGEATLGYKEHEVHTARNTIVVSAGGYGQLCDKVYGTVQAAVDAAPEEIRTIIRITAGTYTEKVVVPKGKILTFQGTGNPVIAYGDTASSAGATRNSATAAILADKFTATGVTFQNTAPAPPGGAVDRQAVALRITGDKGAFYDCKFLGAQDTLFDQQGRHYFKNCYIEGSNDFIFGDGRSLYQDCLLHSIANPGRGALTAQARTGNDNTGFSFVGCSITGAGPIYLGRAWGPNSRVAFIYCKFENITLPTVLHNWGDSSREKTVVYGLYQCSGPGAHEWGSVGWSHELTAAQAAVFSSVSFINGNQWLTK